LNNQRSNSLNIIIITNGHNYILQADNVLVAGVVLGTIAVVGGLISAFFSGLILSGYPSDIKRLTDDNSSDIK
jgi:hypothetical protein